MTESWQTTDVSLLFIRINEEGREPPGGRVLRYSNKNRRQRGTKRRHRDTHRAGAEEAQLANECERGREARRQRGVSRAERRRRGGEVVDGRETADAVIVVEGERPSTAWSFHLSILARIDTLYPRKDRYPESQQSE